MIVSFDFDDTLLFASGANPVMMGKLLEHHQAGDTVIIVTSRNRHHDRRSWIKKYWPSRVSVRAFIAEHQLPVSQIVYTNHRPKGPVLVKHGAAIHYDDDPLEIRSCEECGVRGVLY